MQKDAGERPTQAAIEMITRSEVVAEARSWLTTPYIRRASVKGAGCDCFTLLFAVYLWAGFIPESEAEKVDNAVISSDWFCHVDKGDERYMYWLLKHASKIGEGIGSAGGTLPGNLALCRSVGSSVFNHGGLIVKWPRVIHCTVSSGVAEVSAATDPLWCHNQLVILDSWAKLEASAQ